MPNKWVLDPTKIGPSDEQIANLCEAAEKGYSYSACAATADTTKHMIDFWLNKGRKARQKMVDGTPVTNTETIYASFAEQFDRARARGVKHLEDVSTQRAKDGMGTWSEAITKLERGHRDEFGRQPDLVQSGGPVVIVIEGRPARELPPESFIEGNVVERNDQDELPAAGETTGVS